MSAANPPTPFYGPNCGPVTIRTLGNRAMLDRGEVICRDAFLIAIRSVRTGRPAVYAVMRVRVEPAATRRGLPRSGAANR